jgi:serine/threonine protein kinase
MTEETVFQEALAQPSEQRAAFVEHACAGNAPLRAAVEARLAAHAPADRMLDQPSGELAQTLDSDAGKSPGAATSAFPPPPALPGELGQTLDSNPLAPPQPVTAAFPPAGRGSPDPAQLARAGHGSPDPAQLARAGRGSPDPAQLATTTDYQPSKPLGTVIAGRYRLEQKLGEGGMGEVWIAQQTEPVKRQVALKLIKTGMDSKAVLARFEAERQALALMDHPNIARVLDGGLTGVGHVSNVPGSGHVGNVPHTGQPFFVMELVHGQPLTKFCDEQKLTPRQRLELFVAICQAVQHAHQKGIIHRDLKPANILVTVVDGRPVPKVIDFGVAKATGGSLTEESLATEFGAVVGTLEYMSPEQAGYAGADIDTRADIYTLGVILYELLTGLRPIDVKRLKRAAAMEIIRILHEEEPLKPSTRLSTDDALPSLAALRQTEPKRLMALLRGELDWVVMKCLEKQRERRYETANALARDIQRYLADELVEARPPSAGYRLKKFVRRNKGQVLAASVVLLTLVGGILGTGIGLVQANRAADAEREAKVEAQKNLAYAKKGNDILGSVFAGLDPKANYATVAELRKALRDNLRRAGKELEGSAIGEPMEVAVMQVTLGRSLAGLGEASLAVEEFQKALATSKAKRGPDDSDTLAIMVDLAGAYLASVQLSKAVPLFEEALEKQKATLGPDHPDALNCMNNLAAAYQTSGQLAKAVPLFEETLEKLKAKRGPEHADTLHCMNNLALAYGANNQQAKAVPLLEQVLEKLKAKLGPDHPDTLQSMNNLAVAYGNSSQIAKAVPLFEETLRRQTATLGPEHPETLSTKQNVAVGHALLTSESRYREQLAKLGPTHLGTLLARRDMAQMFMATNRLDDAEVALVEILHGMTDRAPDDAIVVFTTGLLGRCLARRQQATPNAWQTFHTQSLLGGALLDQKRYAQAEPLLLKSYEGMKAREKTIPPQGSNSIPEALDRLIELYTATNKLDEAQKWQTERAKYPQRKNQNANQR